MLIIRKNALRGDLKGTFRYKDEPFTGATLDFSYGVICEKAEFKNGKPVGEYQSPDLAQYEGQKGLHESALDNGFSEPCTYKKEPFSGVVYAFDGKRCIAAKGYEDGVLKAEVQYAADGSVSLANEEKA